MLTRVNASLPLFASLALLCAAPVRGEERPEAYVKHCAPCHGLDGKARTPAGKKLGAKDLSASTLADAAITLQILAGTKDNKGVERMPAFQARLTAEEVAAVAAFVKTFRP